MRFIMDKFVPYKKMSKKARQKIDRMKRSDWGNVKPVLRVEDSPRTYRRHPKHKSSLYQE